MTHATARAFDFLHASCWMPSACDHNQSDSDLIIQHLLRSWLRSFSHTWVGLSILGLVFFTLSVKPWQMWVMCLCGALHFLLFFNPRLQQNLSLSYSICSRTVLRRRGVWEAGASTRMWNRLQSECIPFSFIMRSLLVHLACEVSRLAFIACRTPASAYKDGFGNKVYGPILHDSLPSSLCQFSKAPDGEYASKQLLHFM